MNKNQKLLLGGLAAAGLGYYGYTAIVGMTDKQDDPKLITDRVWIDKRPEKYTDYVHAMYLSKYSPSGVFERASNYEIRLEFTEFKREDGKITLMFPQTGKSASFTFTIKACSDLPPFDLCLDLSENPWMGPKRFYGMSSQEEEKKTLGDMRQDMERALARRR